jgi:putative ABC transport system permease protein
MHFVRIPIENIGRRPVRTTLTVIGLGMAVACFVLLIGLSRGLERGWVGSIVERRTDLLAVRKGPFEVVSTSVDASLAGMLGRQPGVVAATPELLDLVGLDDGSTAIAFGWVPGAYLWETVRLKEGRLPRGEAPEVVVGEIVAAAMGLKPGASLHLLDESFAVVGVSTDEGVLMGNAIVMPLAALQALLDREGRATNIQLKLADVGEPEAQAATIGALARHYPNLMFTRTRDLVESNRVMRFTRALAWITAVIGLLIGVVVTANTLLMSVTERTREIGTLTALGWSRGRVMTLIMAEALAISVAGGLIGIGLGAVLLRAFAEVSIVRGFVDPQLSLSLLAETAVATVLVGLAASGWPAWRAASIVTAEALRHE